MLQDRYFFYSDFNCPYCFALNERILMLGDSGTNRLDRDVGETLARH